MTISIDKGLYDNHYKKYDPNFKITEKREKEIEEEVIELKKKYPDVFK